MPTVAHTRCPHRLSRSLYRSVTPLAGCIRAAAVCSAIAGALSITSAVEAQAFNYPALQTPSASVRDYTGAIVGGAGTTLLFQWRESAGQAMHWQFDGGFADPKGEGDPLLFLGVGLGKELVRAAGDQPLDVLLTAGAGASFGSGSYFRIPIGASVGHTFALEDDMSLTPFVHPRVSIDQCSTCRPGFAGGRGRSRLTASLNFDLGAHWQVNRQFGVRVAATFSGSDVVGGDETLALGLNWSPAALSRE